jgi:hypothetical protein
MVIPINETITDVVYDVINSSGPASPVANARITNSSPCAKPSIEANAAQPRQGRQQSFLMNMQMCMIAYILVSMLMLMLMFFAVLRSYVNDHTAFQLGLPLFLDRIYVCQRAQRDSGSIIEVKLMQLTKILRDMQLQPPLKTRSVCLQ